MLYVSKSFGMTSVNSWTIVTRAHVPRQVLSRESVRAAKIGKPRGSNPMMAKLRSITKKGIEKYKMIKDAFRFTTVRAPPFFFAQPVNHPCVSVVNLLSMELLYWHAGRLTSLFGGFWP
jgi:hypothetical protein